MNINLIGIHKTFGKIHANNDINISIPGGTIHGLLGENGAGKSTLMKILSGFQAADKGEIIIDDKKVSVRTPGAALALGIGMLHQDPLDFPPMTVLENFLTGRKKDGNLIIFPNRNYAEKEFLSIRDKLGFQIRPEAHVDTLSVGERQQLEIIRLLWLGVQILILDEPTTGISANQKMILFSTLKLLANEGKTILFVSHKLDDIEQLCHQITILRQGYVVSSAYPPYDLDFIVSCMFGKTIKQVKHYNHSTQTPSIILQNVSFEVNRLEMKDINTIVYSGEVIGLAGMEGSGQLEFMKICAGLIRPSTGKVFIDSFNLTGKNYFEFLNHGVFYVPASRLEDGLIPGMMIYEHFLLLKKYGKFFLDRQSSIQITQNHINEFSIKGTPLSLVNELSGGNQQRTQLALIPDDSKIILMEHPTRGLDVESSYFIWEKLNERCRNGATILFISSDLEEIVKYSDRVMVFFSGKVSKLLPSKSTSSEELGVMIGGKGW